MGLFSIYLIIGLALVVFAIVAIIYLIMNNEFIKNLPKIIGNCALALGIIIITNVLIFQIVDLVWSQPKWNDFCGSVSKAEILSEEKCVEVEGEWIADSGVTTVGGGYCDTYTKCNAELAVAQDSYNQKAFISGIVIGIILLLLGAFIVSNKTISIALILSAILDLFISSVAYWGDAGKSVRVALLAAVLIIIIVVILKLDKKDKK